MTLTHVLIYILGMTSKAVSYFESLYNHFMLQYNRLMYNDEHPHRYFLSNGYQLDRFVNVVPKGEMYFEEFTDDENDKRIRVLYEDDYIEKYEGDPWREVKTPWIWIGHVPSNTNLTSALKKYMIPGNFIMMDLLVFLLGEDEKLIENFHYMDPRTMELIKFPVEGIRIEADE